MCMMIRGAADRLWLMIWCVQEKIRENRQFTITPLSLHFPQISRSLLHEIVSDKLKFRKLCARWEDAYEEHKFKWQDSALDFLTRYSEEADNFLRHVVAGARHGCRTKHLNRSSSPRSGGTLHRQQRRNSSKPLQLGRTCA